MKIVSFTFDISLVLKVVLINKISILMSAKLATPGLLIKYILK